MKNCYDNPDEPGWYQIGSSVGGWTADDKYLQRNTTSHYLAVCDCENQQEAREQLGPPPSEYGVDGGSAGDVGSTEGERGSGSDGDDGGGQGNGGDGIGDITDGDADTGGDGVTTGSDDGAMGAPAGVGVAEHATGVTEGRDNHNTDAHSSQL